MKLWKDDPHCKMCGKLVDYPFGFELDHIVPLSAGGEDTIENSQVLCVWYEEGKKMGCHVEKSRKEAAQGWI